MTDLEIEDNQRGVERRCNRRAIKDDRKEDTKKITNFMRDLIDLPDAFESNLRASNPHKNEMESA